MRWLWKWCRAALRLQAWAVEGYPPDTMQLKAGNLLVGGQAATSAPAQSHRGLREIGPAQLMRGLVP